MIAVFILNNMTEHRTLSASENSSKSRRPDQLEKTYSITKSVFVYCASVTFIQEKSQY